ncbi:MAG: AbrB/MazE/SpoVT family DNA-binding domain-containing protein [Acidobacteria bacterium]|nr:AbrB/MazE/SpoVT family DNA-binding domain-containing protein [Acidobacteriota bacterium]
MEDIHSTIAEGGRIVIPADYRRALDLKVGDEVILRMADGEVHILTRRQAIKKAQALVRKHVPERKSLVQELIRERRGEAANE